MPYFVIRTKKSAYIWIQNYRLLWRTNYPGTLSNNRDNNPVQKICNNILDIPEGVL